MLDPAIGEAQRSRSAVHHEAELGGFQRVDSFDVVHVEDVSLPAVGGGIGEVRDTPTSQPRERLLERQPALGDGVNDARTYQPGATLNHPRSFELA